MANKFLIKDLSDAYSKTSKLKSDCYALVELSGTTYNASYTDVFKDVLSNHLTFKVSRPKNKGPNKLSAIYVDENNQSVCLTSISLQDGMLSTYEFNQSTSTLSLIFNALDPTVDPVVINLDSLKDIYDGGHGITLSGHYFNADDSMTIVTDTINQTSVFAIDGELTRNNTSSWTNASSIKIGSTVDSIGNGSLSAFNQLTSVSIPFGVKSIGNEAFYNDSSLKSIDVGGNQLATIGSGAFNRCSQLSSAVFPESVVKTGEGAFYGCNNLVNFVIPRNIVEISPEAFANCGFKSIDVPTNASIVGYNTFAECSSLTNVVLPCGMAIIASGMFNECINLSSIKIPDTIKQIDSGAFYACSSLTSIEIPPSVSSIGNDAFGECSSLLSIIFKNRSTASIPAGQKWGAPASTVVTTWNDASQEWVIAQDYLISSDISARYDDSTHHVKLSAQGRVVGDIDCSEFLKDGRLSNVQLTNDKLVFEFNADANQTAISVDLSNFIDKSKYETFSSTVSSLSNYGYAMSSDISRVFIKDPSVPAYENGKQSDLSVIKIDESSYAQMLSTGSAEPNALYVISSNFINAYGQQIKNLSAGTDLSDAVNLEQLQNVSSSIPLSTSQLQNDSGFLSSADIELNPIYDVSGAVIGYALSSQLDKQLQKANLLSGITYDFSTNVGLYTGVRDLISALGGTVTNFPAIN